MPKEIVIYDFSGGRNTYDAVPLIPAKQHSAGGNVWSENLALSKRRGFTTATVSASGLSLIPEQMIATHMEATGLLRLVMIGRVAAHAQRYLFYTENGTIFTLIGYTTGTVSTAGSSTTVTGSGTAWISNIAVGDYFFEAAGTPNRITAVNSDTQIVVTTAVNLSAGTSYTIIQAIAQGRPSGLALFDVSSAQNLFVVDGTRAYRYDGTTCLRADQLYSTPAAKILVTFKNYLFYFRQDDINMRWSALKDPTSNPAGNTQTITYVGDPLRGAVVYADSIIIFTRSRMFRVMGDTFDPANPTFVIEEIAVPNDFTFMFSRTAVEHRGALKFLTTDGWYEYIGGHGIRKISQEIQTDVDAFRRLAFAAEAMADSAVAFVWKGKLWCCVPDNNETPADNLNTLYVLDENGSWWKWPTAVVAAAGQFSDFSVVKYGSTGTYILQAGNTGTNKLSTIDTGNSDDGGAINGTWDSKEFTSPGEVEFVEAIVTMKKQSAGNLTFSLSIDRAAFIDFTCDMTAGVGTVIEKRVPIGRLGKAIRFRVANNIAAQTFEIYRLRVLYEPTEGVRI